MRPLTQLATIYERWIHASRAASQPCQSSEEHHMDLQEIFANVMDWDTIIPALIRIVLIIAGALLVNILLTRLMRRIEKRIETRGVTEGDLLSESRRRAQTIAGLARQVVTVSIGLLAFMLVLQETGVEIGPILAGAGIVGVALGFGAQSMVADLIAGFFLILENHVRIGDAARVNGTWGMVEKISFRTLVLRDMSGEVHIFPNSSISTMSNLSNGWAAHVFNLGVAYKEDVDKVAVVIQQVMQELREDEEYGPVIIEDGEIFGLDEFADSAVVIRGRIRTLPLLHLKVKREFNRRIKLAFDAAGIEIPFPHRTLYYGEASQPFEVTGIPTQRDSA
jgi:small conductance mechanosensitive channel